ncbi:MAG: hypothetical protein IJ545_07120 [Alphaproteobacteria bacterium]|nr:hypothetical protein [Alphaproteobacteria bacterium]
MENREINAENKCAELEAGIEVFNILAAIPEQIHGADDLLPFLREQGSYLDKINYTASDNLTMVNLSERPLGNNLLERINTSSPFYKELTKDLNIDRIREFLDKELQKINLTFEELIFEKENRVSFDTRHIIRMDFNGFASEPDSDQLSDTYLKLHLDPARKGGQEFEYDRVLQENKSWQTFQQFPRFKKIGRDFRQALAYAKIPLENVKDINSFDFEDLLFKYHRSKAPKESFKYNLFGHDGGAREQTVRKYVANHKEELRSYFLEVGALKGYEEQLLAKDPNLSQKDMKSFAQSKFEKMLNDMENGYISPVPLPNGEFLTATVHHIRAIQDADPKNITQVNESDNHIIIFRRQTKEDKSTLDSTLGDALLFDAFKKQKISLDDIGDIPDFNTILTSRKEETLGELTPKQKFIKLLAEKKSKEIVAALQKIGVDERIIELANQNMLKQPHEFPAINLSNNRQLAVALKKTKRGVKLVFNAVYKASPYSDVHQSIFHAVTDKLVSKQISADPNTINRIISANEETDLPGSNKYKSETDNSIKEVFYRIKTKTSQIFKGMAFVLEGFGKKQIILTNEKDLENYVPPKKQTKSYMQSSSYTQKTR